MKFIRFGGYLFACQIENDDFIKIEDKEYHVKGTLKTGNDVLLNLMFTNDQKDNLKRFDNNERIYVSKVKNHRIFSNPLVKKFNFEGKRI